MTKFSSIKEVLIEIEKLDCLISTMLEEEKYGKILESMKQRLILVSELTRIKNTIGITESEKLILERIFSGANNIMTKVEKKQKLIKERLDKKKKISIQNKKIEYK